MNQSKKTQEIIMQFQPRELRFYERSFVAAFIIVLISLAAMLFLEFIIPKQLSLSHSVNVVFIPWALMSAIFMGYAYATRRTGLIEINTLLANADALKAYINAGCGKSSTVVGDGGGQTERPLREAFMHCVEVLGKRLRNLNVDSDEDFSSALQQLYGAFGPEKAAAGNGVIPKFGRSYYIVGSKKLKKPQTAVLLMFIVFWLVTIVSAVLINSDGILHDTYILNPDHVFVLTFVYAFSLVCLVARNMLAIFGTKKSQYRVSLLVERLLYGLK